jgi:tetratricopeptide (TPR) repeat protein
MGEPDEATTDELWDALATVTGRDRVEVLLELASRAHRQHDLARAQALLGEAEHAAGDLGDEVQVALCQYHQADLAQQVQDFATARELFAASAQGFLGAGDSVRAAQALAGLAQTHYSVHDWQQCLEAATESARIAEAEQAIDVCGDACFWQARALYYLDREQQALAAAATAREHFRTCGEPGLVAQVDDFAITVALYLDEVDRALELARGCLVLTRGADGEDDPNALIRLAEVHNRRGEVHEALRCADLARSSHREGGDLAGVARCEMVRGGALWNLDRLEEALTAYIEAGVLFDATGWDSDALYAHVRQSVVLHGLGRYLEAARLNRELVAGYLNGSGEALNAQWCVVRLLDNLFEAKDFPGLLAAAEEYSAAWAEDVDVTDRAYRECLGFRAAALEETGQREQAWELADRVIEATPARDAGGATALCYEIRSRSRADEAEAVQDVAHAIALHVARGKMARARQLSDHFLSEDSGEAARGKPVG